MEVKVLGTGCAKCKKLYEATEKAIQDLGVQATLTKVEKLEEMMAYQLLVPPGLVIDGELKVAGRIPSATELASLLTTAAAKR